MIKDSLKKDVKMGLIMVVPKLARANLKNYENNIEKVAEFLLKMKGNRNKWFLTMCVDYFNCLLQYYQDILKLKGFRMVHIDSFLAQELYINFLEDRGSLYWNGVTEDSTITTGSGTIHKTYINNAKDINLEEIKGGLKEKYE